MASLEIGPLSAYLDDDELAAVEAALDEHGLPGLDEDEDAESRLIEGGIDSDLLADFMDQLEANDAGCDLYLPMEFEEVIEVSGYTLGSSHALLLALTEMKDELGIDEDEGEVEAEVEVEEDEDFEEFDDDDDEEEGDSLFDDDEQRGLGLKDAQMRAIWKAFQRGGTTAIAKGVSLRVSRK